MGLTYDQQEPLWDARTGLVHHGEVTLHECLRRLIRALPTAAHAGRLAEILLEALGDRGRLDPYTDGAKAMVLRADPPGWWLRRSPAAVYDGAEYAEHDVASEVPLGARPADAPPGWEPGTPFRPSDPEPDLLPRDLGRAVLTLRSGDALLELRYDHRGLPLVDQVLCRFGDRWAERRWSGLWPPTVDPAARPPQAPPPPWLVDFPEDPPSVEALAEQILAADPALDPVRVRMNVDAPGGVEGCWWRGKMSLRKLAMDEQLPPEGGVYVVDAYDYDPERTCLARGDDLAEAEAAWLAEERRRRPKPARPVALPEDDARPEEPRTTSTETVDEEGKKTVVLSLEPVRVVVHPVRVIPWPIPGPNTTPAVAVRVPPLPTEVPPTWRAEGFTRWRYVVGESGQLGFVLVRDDPGGFTLVGDGVLDLVEPRGLEQAMQAAMAETPDHPRPEPPWLRYPFEHRHFAAWTDLRQGPTPLRAAGTTWNEEWNWRDQDGDIARWRVCRMRHRPA